MRHRLYIVLGILVLILMYLVPYIMYHDVKDFTLLMYWTSLSLIWIVVSSIYLHAEVRE
ncbi:MAG: hypothetical protein QXF49_06440 [Thermosphaera sp.]